MPPSVASQHKQTILIVEDHEMVLSGTTSALKQAYPNAVIQTALTSKAALKQLENSQPDLVIVDLSMPESTGSQAQTEVGIQLLEILMKRYPTLNIVVQSAYSRSLVRLKPLIDRHQGGFTVAGKDLPLQQMLIKVDWALKGVIYTPPDMRNGLEMKPDWLTVLQLAFQESLTDQAIAKRMNIAPRTVGYYWSHIRDKLNVHPHTHQNDRSLTAQRAREAGFELTPRFRTRS